MNFKVVILNNVRKKCQISQTMEYSIPCNFRSDLTTSPPFNAHNKKLFPISRKPNISKKVDSQAILLKCIAY